MTPSRPHLVKRVGRRVNNLYSTPKHISQGSVQIRGGSRFEYMRNPSQNPKPVVHMYPFEALGESFKLIPTLQNVRIVLP
jgi:hypothetical protein